MAWKRVSLLLALVFLLSAFSGGALAGGLAPGAGKTIAPPAAVPVETAAGASADVLAFAAKYAEAFLRTVGDSSSLSTPVSLYSVSGGLEAVCFVLSPSGYLIVNVHDGTVPEYSPTAPVPVPQDGRSVLVYNGPLEYYEQSRGVYAHTVTGLQVTAEQLVERYNHTGYAPEPAANAVPGYNAPTSTATYLSGSLSTFVATTMYLCPTNAAAILLDYYQRTYGGNYLPSGYTTKNQICNLLNTGLYVAPCGLTMDQLDSEHYYNGNLYLGLGYYLWSSVSKTTNVETYSFTPVKTRINQGKPIILAVQGPLLPDLDVGEGHAIVVHGYFNASSLTNSFLIVNNGWGSNNIWIYASSSAVANAAYGQILYVT
jgi:hypothetical protein